MFKIFQIVFVISFCINNVLTKINEKSVITDDSDNSSLYRLPKNILPESYEILLLTNITRSDFDYNGTVKIDLRVIEKTNKVILHTDKLQVIKDKTILSNELFQEVQINNQIHNEETQFFIINLLEDLKPGRYFLTLYFVGQAIDDVFGFYRSSYRVNNEIRWIGVTQFSPVFARRAFPCMDEPGFKAIFQLSLGHYGNETVTSNTFPESQVITSRANYYVTKFGRTPRMSTYLLGWSIHDFNRVNSTIDSRFWLWTNFKNLSSLNESPMLVDGPKIYSSLEAYTELSNPVPKIEQFAVPDFYFSAMENWGFITYRESVPLVSYFSTPLQKIHKNLVIQGHEYAHTWFGNIITPSFWNIMWLKEGFATYFSYLAINKVHPDWRMMDLFTVDNMQMSLLSDSADHNRTMNGKGVGKPETARAAMDFVTYDKAASVIRMIADVLGEELFQKAIRSYLKDRQYKAVTPADFYKHLQMVLTTNATTVEIPVSIDKIIETWTTQSNYPLVRVSRISSKKFNISQEIFKLNRSKISDKESKSYWWIPITLTTISKSSDELIKDFIWLGPEKSKTIELSFDDSKEGWFVLNPNLNGYYRVDYDKNNWYALKKLLKSNDYQKLSRVNRAGLIDDVFNLARAGFEDYYLALDIVKYLNRETDYEPWVAASRAFNLLDNKLRDKTNVREAFRKYTADLITPIYKKLSFNENPMDSHIEKMHRDLILSTACSLNLHDCVSNAKSIFDNWIADENKLVPANLKSSVYRIGIVNGTDENWMKLWEKFVKTDVHSEEEIMIKALASTENPLFINRFFNFSIQPESYIAIQYRLTIIQSIISGSSKNIETILEFVEENFDEIITLRGNAFLQDILSAVGKEIVSEEQLNKFSSFVKRNIDKLGKAKETGKKAVESARENVVSANICAEQISHFLTG